MAFIDYRKVVDYGEQKFVLQALKTKEYKKNTVE